MLKHFAWLLVGGALVMASTVAWSQVKQPTTPPATGTKKPEDKKPEDKKPDDKQPADPKTTDKPDDKKPEEPQGPAAKKFAASYDGWKNALKKLRDLRNKYDTTPGTDKAAQDQLRKDWDAAIADAEKLLPDLRKDTLAAYEEAPNLDSTITRFLVKLLADDVAHDEYDNGKVIADALIKNGCDLKQIHNYAGIIAFVNNDYDEAEKQFNIAKQANALDREGLGARFSSILKEYKELWAKEKEIREAEAKAEGEEALPRVKIETTKGTIVVELFENEAPQTVGNFVNLVEKKFYDGLVFHRVLPNFMAQGGDPQGNGRGGPGYTIHCECHEKNHRNHFRGTLSMAHAGLDTGGSQFFMTFIPTDGLNGKHTAFGRVIEGMDVLAKLQRINPEDPASASIKPDKIVKAEVIRKRKHDYVPSKSGEK